MWSTKKHKEEYNRLKRAFSRKGYVLVDRLVNSLEYGVEHERERVILFGIKYSLLRNDKGTARNILKSNFNWDIDPKYTIDIIKSFRWPITTEFNIESKLQCPANIVNELTIEYWFNKNDVYKHFNYNDYFER